MNQYLSILTLFILLGCSSKEQEYSEAREGNHLYPVEGMSDEKYCTFERFMWDAGFPDTIIVKFTRDGKFERYVEAVRQGVLEDSLGNYYSPAYVFYAHNGDNWVYNLKGEFIEFNRSIDSDNNSSYQYNP